MVLSSLLLLIFLYASPSISWEDSDHDHNHKCLAKDAATSIISSYYAIWESRDMTTITKLVNDFATDSITREDKPSTLASDLASSALKVPTLPTSRSGCSRCRFVLQRQRSRRKHTKRCGWYMTAITSRSDGKGVQLTLVETQTCRYLPRKSPYFGQPG